MQEIGTTAPATLYWGDTEMDWDTLSFVAGVLNERYHTLRTRFFIGSSNIRYLHKRFVEPDMEYDQSHNRGNFAYELHRARHLLAQDPRDHVYAFLGHFSIRRGSQALQGLVADYAKSIQDVYIDVAVRGLRDASDLVMLAATHHSRPAAKRRSPQDKGDIDLPSWVPDWRDLPMHILGSPAVPHRASRDTRPELTIDEDARILHIRGIRVDVVVRHSWTIYGTAFQVRQDAQGKSKTPWWKHRQDDGDAQPQNQTPTNNGDKNIITNSKNHSNNVKSSNSRHHHHQTRTLHQRRSSQGEQQQPQQHHHGPRTHPLEVLWKHICGYQTFTLSHIYPPFRTRDDASSPSSSAASPPDHSKSAFFALIQTLTNACTGMDRTRPYSSVSPEEWLASGAAYLVRYGLPTPSPLSPSQTFPSLPSKASKNNIMSTVFERANSLSTSSFSSSSPSSSSSQRSTPISPAIHALSLTGDPFKWSHEATLITRYRRFAKTRRGYFVLGPDALQEGDVVAVLRGGKTPFLLRRVSPNATSTSTATTDSGNDGGDQDCWVLVGECYVHGLMDGEAWDAEGVEEVFSIR